MITVSKQQIKKNIPLKKMADKTCPHCGSLTAFEYKDSRSFICGSILRKAIYGMEPHLSRSIQCDIIQDLKLRLMLVTSSIEGKGVSLRANYVTGVEYLLVKTLNDEHKNILTSHTNQEPT